MTTKYVPEFRRGIAIITTINLEEKTAEMIPLTKYEEYSYGYFYIPKYLLENDEIIFDTKIEAIQWLIKENKKRTQVLQDKVVASQKTQAKLETMLTLSHSEPLPGF